MSLAFLTPLLALEIVASILSLIGYLFVAKKRVEGFYIWIVANILLLYVVKQKELHAIAALYVAYSLLTIYSIQQWRHNDKKNK